MMTGLICQAFLTVAGSVLMLSVICLWIATHCLLHSYCYWQDRGGYLGDPSSLMFRYKDNITFLFYDVRKPFAYCQ